MDEWMDKIEHGTVFLWQWIWLINNALLSISSVQWFNEQLNQPYTTEYQKQDAGCSC